MKAALLSGSNELVTDLEVEKYILEFLEEKQKNINVNDYYSFRCPICFLPVSFVKRSNNKTSYFKHIGADKDSSCPFYIGDKGSNLKTEVPNFHLINKPSELFLKLMKCRRFYEWSQFENLEFYDLFPTYYKEMLVGSMEISIFFWYFPIINFIESLNRKSFLDVFNYQVDGLKKSCQKAVNVVFLSYEKIEKFAQFKVESIRRYLENLKELKADILIEANMKPSYFLPNNRIWFYSKKIKTFPNIPLNLLQGCKFLYSRFKNRINPFLKPKLKEGIYIGYFDKKGSCNHCHNPIHLVLALPYKSNDYFQIFRKKGLNYSKIHNKFFCRGCSRELFSIEKWFKVIRQNVKNANEISIGDEVKFRFGDYKDKIGVVLSKEQQDLIINVLMESGEEIKQSIF